MRALRSVGVAVVAWGAIACQEPFSDPLGTGLRLAPTPGEVEGPVVMRAANGTGLDLSCVVHELDVCPTLGADLLDELAWLDVDEVWRVENVSCATLDVACWPDPVDDTTPPLRAWGWSIVPPDVEEVAANEASP
jgi:hypothetical protein